MFRRLAPLLILFLFFCPRVHSAETVCLTQLWEEFDYGYCDEEGNSGEYSRAVWTVEVRHDLPCGMVGWIYAGIISVERVLWYDTMYDRPADHERIWWGTAKKHGEAATRDEAIKQILDGRPFCVAGESPP